MYFVLVLTLLCFICVDIVVTFVSCCILVVMCFSTWGSFCFCCFFHICLVRLCVITICTFIYESMFLI